MLASSLPIEVDSEKEDSDLFRKTLIHSSENSREMSSSGDEILVTDPCINEEIEDNDCCDHEPVKPQNIVAQAHQSSSTSAENNSQKQDYTLKTSKSSKKLKSVKFSVKQNSGNGQNTIVPKRNAEKLSSYAYALA